VFPGGGELVFIVLVVLLLFGGKELPRIARLMGQWSSTMRRSLNEVRREFNRIGIEDELKDVSSAMKGNPVRGSSVKPPEGPTTARVPNPDAEGEYVPPNLQYPDAIEPTRDPSKPTEKPLKEKPDEAQSPHPEDSSNKPDTNPNS
jgi:sec-independent protein translocase protein TatA